MNCVHAACLPKYDYDPVETQRLGLQAYIQTTRHTITYLPTREISVSQFMHGKESRSDSTSQVKYNLNYIDFVQ